MTANVVTTEQGVGQLDRRTYIGGSDVAAIQGLSPWQTPLQCYLAKIDGAPEPTEAKKKLFRRGHRWEPVALDYTLDDLEDRDGERPIVTARNLRYRDSEYPFLCAEVDAEIVRNGNLANVELKTVYPIASKAWGAIADDDGEMTDEIPIYYAAQAMYGLGMLPDRQNCIVGALIGADRIMTYDLKRNDETIAATRERCVKFWRDHVLKRIPPEPVNLADILLLYRETNGRPVELDEETLRLVNGLARVREEIKLGKLDEDQLKYQIATYIRKQWNEPALSELKDNAQLLFAGEKVASWNKQSSRRLDGDRLRADHPELADKYSKTLWTRVLRLVKPKT